MADKEIVHQCSVCSCDYTDDEGGVQGNFGILPVSFCPTCFSCMCDMAQYYNDSDEIDEPVKEEIKPEYAEMMRHLKGITHVVINRRYGGFSLSYEGKIAYLEAAGITYTLGDQADRDAQIRLGPKIIVEGSEFNDRKISRDDPALVSVVKKLKDRANGEYAQLRIVEVPGDVKWQINEYDGQEWVAETHRIWR